MFEVEITRRFVATHQIVDAMGEWEPLHEHDWRVTVTYRGPRLDAQGLLVDFVAVEEDLRKALADLDEQNLNEVGAMSGQNPSAENVAMLVAGRMPSDLDTALLHAVEVEEAPGCIARWFSGGC